MRFLAESQPVLSQSPSLNLLSAWFSNKAVSLNLTFTFSSSDFQLQLCQSHFHFQNISTYGFQIQPCHSTWFSNKTVSLNLAFTFTQLSILSYEVLLQDETLARKYHSCKIFWSVVSIWCIFGWWLVRVWRIVRTRENG